MLLEINDAQKRNVAVLYDKTIDRLNEDVLTLKEWMKIQPHLPEIMGDAKIRNFLMLNKCNIERTKQKIELYYTIRSEIGDVFDKSNPKLPELKETFTYLYFVPLPKLTPDMYRVTIFKVRNSVLAQKYDPILTTIQFYNTAEIRLEEDFMFGDILVFDLEGVSFNMLTSLTPSIFFKIRQIYQVYTIGLKAIIFINSPLYIDKVLSLLKAVIKPKIFDRIYIYSDSAILREIFPKEILPRDYGGQEKSLEELSAYWKVKFAEYQERFDKLDEMRVIKKFKPENRSLVKNFNSSDYQRSLNQIRVVID